MARFDAKDDEGNRMARRVKRYAKVGAGVGSVAARMAGSYLLGQGGKNDKHAAELRIALEGLKGPLVKVAQMLATIPEALPEEFTAELASLQSNAPPMGWPFVRRRMNVELGSGWQAKFRSFDREASAAASLGQVHRATSLDVAALACKLQYPDMESAVEADLVQLKMILSVYRRVDGGVETDLIAEEVGARLREELDYELEARHMALFRDVLAPLDTILIPRVDMGLTTKRLLTMEWLEGVHVLSMVDAPLEERNSIVRMIFRAWWMPFSHYGIIHGDPHLGNYTVRPGELALNLLDFGCIRTFPASFVHSVIELYRALQDKDRDRMVSAYESWGFKNLTHELIDVLNIWAEFIYGPMLDDRVRTVADGIKPGAYGRREINEIQQKLRELGPVRLPREFVFLERAAIGLGAVFLHLDAALNFHDLFQEMIADFDAPALQARQTKALEKTGVPLPV